MTEFAKTILAARKKKSLTQRGLAALVLKEDGKPISGAYLNDIEHGKRDPTSRWLLRQLGLVLDVEPTYLEYLAGLFPESGKELRLTEKEFVRRYRAFMRA